MSSAAGGRFLAAVCYPAALNALEKGIARGCWHLLFLGWDHSAYMREKRPCPTTGDCPGYIPQEGETAESPEQAQLTFLSKQPLTSFIKGIRAQLSLMNDEGARGSYAINLNSQ